MEKNQATLPQGGRRQCAAGFNCRFCSAPLKTSFVDLGMSPLCQTHIAADRRHEMEPFCPLHVYVCGQCFLVQLQELVTPQDIFGEYAYFSSYSTSWVEHARRYADMAIVRFGLGGSSRVITASGCWAGAGRGMRDWPRRVEVSVPRERGFIAPVPPCH